MTPAPTGAVSRSAQDQGRDEVGTAAPMLASAHEGSPKSVVGKGIGHFSGAYGDRPIGTVMTVSSGS